MEEEDGFDNLLTTIGFGSWQAPFIISTVLIGSQLPVHLVGSPLLSAPMPFHCSSVPFATTEHPSYDKKDNGTYFNNTCLSPSTAGTGGVTEEIVTGNTTGSFTGLESCPYVQYETSIFTSTVVSQWNLICEQDLLLPLFQMMYNIGGLIGSTLGGHIADRFGRKRAVLIGTVCNLVGIGLMACVPYYSIVLTMRIVTGAMHNVMLLPIWSLTLESTPARHRSLVGMLMGLPYSCGVVMFAGIGYYIRTWQYLILVCATPAALLLPFAIGLDESPRWLIQQGRLDDASKVLKNAVKKNNVKLDVALDTTISKLHEVAKTPSPVTTNTDKKSMVVKAKIDEVMKYFRSPAMRAILLATPALWFLQAFLYLSVAINANNFTSTDPYLYVALTGVMDGTAIILSTPLATRIGRKVMIFCGLFIGALLFLFDLLIPTEYFWAKWVMVMSGFLLVGSSFQVNYVYAPELFPTEIRGRGFALVNLIANIGFICAPLVTDILAKYTWWAGGVFFGCAGILGSFMIPFLPETRNIPLPETLHDVETRSNKSKRNQKNFEENKGYESEKEREV